MSRPRDGPDHARCRPADSDAFVRSAPMYHRPYSSRPGNMRLWLVPVGLQLAISTLGAQTSPPADTIADARRMRDASDFAGAAALMRAYTQSHPDDAGSARFAALMAYWSK